MHETRVVAAKSRTPIYLTLGILLIPASAVIGLVFPAALILTVPLAILSFYRAFTVKQCAACRKEIPIRATTCPSCHASLAPA